MSKKLISILSPCYNEEDNIDELYRRVVRVLDALTDYNFEFLFIDNSSTDNTVEKIKAIIDLDKRIKLIVNIRNFGHLRSPYWGMLQTKGEATICMASDLQEPPELIPQFIAAWESGFKLVMGTKPSSTTNPAIHFLRRSYYRMLDGISDVSITRDMNGFGLYDKCVLDEIRKINDPYPYLRGLVCELGFPIKAIEYIQPTRYRGTTKNNFYTLYDMALLGIVSHSMLPIRLSAFTGVFVGLISVLASFVLLIMKIIWWDLFAAGTASILVLMFMMFGVVMFFIGILGEYIGVIHNFAKRRPIVVEKERINF
jgi:dolichol-phosphate mannosyltransferase